MAELEDARCGRGRAWATVGLPSKRLTDIVNTQNRGNNHRLIAGSNPAGVVFLLKLRHIATAYRVRSHAGDSIMTILFSITSVIFFVAWIWAEERRFAYKSALIDLTKRQKTKEI